MWTRRDRPQVTVSPGFLLLLAGLLYLDQGTGMLPWALLACALHEAGHTGAALSMGGRVRRLSLSVIGAELDFAYDAPLSYGRESLVALAGPAVNLAAGALACAARAYLPGALSLGVGAFNLLPILPLDGGQVLYNALADWMGPGAADRALTVTAGVLVGLLMGVGAIAAAAYANVTLLLTASWLLWGTMRRSRRRAM